MHVASESAVSSNFAYDNLGKLTEACVNSYNESVAERRFSPEAGEHRGQLVKYIRRFHDGSGTLTPRVKEAIETLENGPCLLLMTAHQPNLFAYSGVLRKATLNQVLAQSLSERLGLPVVSFFGIADQDFTDDRWVRSALLPDVERREGLLKLRFDMPEKLMLNRVAKPSRKVLDGWREEIRSWMTRGLSSVGTNLGSLGIQNVEKDWFYGNFEAFWSLVEEAHERAENYADFNAYLMSRIVNDVWEYGAVFSRFSECQQIFEREFSYLLSNFDKYSRCVREACLAVNETNGVFDEEYETAPFWYHCDCGSKARLKVQNRNGVFVGKGNCIRCENEYELDFGKCDNTRIVDYIDRVSARSLSMPLVFFHGLSVNCYVGGLGGTAYLQQAKCVSDQLGLPFPTIAVWRPKDVYFGLGQIQAMIVFNQLSGSFDFSKYPDVENSLRAKIASVQIEVVELEVQKNRLLENPRLQKEEQIRNLKTLSAKQNEVRKEACFSVLVKDLNLLENVVAVMNLHPCIVDYAVNVGLKETSKQWTDYLQNDGSLSVNIRLGTGFGEIKAWAQNSFAEQEHFSHINAG